MIVARTSSPEATASLAAAVADLARPGDLVVLAGDLGAGKTAFVQGFGAALGVTEPITSPTFTLAHRYEGRLIVHHLDVYRLERLEEVLDLDLPELLDDQSVTLVEWGDAIAPVLPADHLEIRLRLGEADDDRTLEFRCVGAGWNGRERALVEALAPWSPSC